MKNVVYCAITLISTQALSMEDLKKAIAKHDIKTVTKLLTHHGAINRAPAPKKTRTAPVTNSAAPALNLQTLLQVATAAETESHESSGTTSRVAKIFGGCAFIGYALANVAVNYSYAQNCENTQQQAASGVLNNTTVLAPLVGGCYLLYGGIANTSTATDQANATAITTLLQGLTAAGTV